MHRRAGRRSLRASGLARFVDEVSALKGKGTRLGQVVEWNDERGYGFILPQDGGSRVFLHIRSLNSRGRRPKTGDWLRFSETQDSEGRFRAESAAWLSQSKSSAQPGRSSSKPLMLFAFAVLAGVIILMLLGIFPDHLAYLALGMSILSFAIYGLDKNAAEKGDRRTPENVLHLFSVLGGWPGALIAQQGFRHKNRKTSFQSVFWLTVIVNLGLMAWLWRTDNLASLVAQVIGQ